MTREELKTVIMETITETKDDIEKFGETINQASDVIESVLDIAIQVMDMLQNVDFSINKSRNLDSEHTTYRDEIAYRIVKKIVKSKGLLKDEEWKDQTI